MYCVGAKQHIPCRISLCMVVMAKSEIPRAYITNLYGDNLEDVSSDLTFPKDQVQISSFHFK